MLPLLPLFSVTSPPAIILNGGKEVFRAGTLYIHEVGRPGFVDAHDLGLSSKLAGCRMGKIPHMVVPQPPASASGHHENVLVSYTADDVFEVVDVKTRKTIACAEVGSKTFGGDQFVAGDIHTGFWFDKETVVMVDMTGSTDGGAGGGLLHRYLFSGDSALSAPERLTYDGSVSVAAPGRPTKPIAAGFNPRSKGQRVFVTDGKGGGSVVDIREMKLLKRFEPDEFSNCNGGGGLWVEPHPTKPSHVLALYGKQVENTSCIVVVNMESMVIDKVITLGNGAIDLHSLNYCTPEGSASMHLIATNRVSRTVEVLDLETEAVKQTYLMENALMPDIGVSVGNRIYYAGRGHDYLQSAVKPDNYHPAAVAGVYSITVLPDCTVTKLGSDISLPTLGNALLIPDVHGINALRTESGKTEIWAIDQAGTHLSPDYVVAPSLVREEKSAQPTCADVKEVYTTVGSCCGEPTEKEIQGLICGEGTTWTGEHCQMSPLDKIDRTVPPPPESTPGGDTLVEVPVDGVVEAPADDEVVTVPADGVVPSEAVTTPTDGGKVKPKDEDAPAVEETYSYGMRL
jgi:hypothetical protein